MEYAMWEGQNRVMTYSNSLVRSKKAERLAPVTDPIVSKMPVTLLAERTKMSIVK